MQKAGAILFRTDMERLFNENMDNFKFNFLLRGQLGSLSIDNFFFFIQNITMSRYEYFVGNFIFALIVRTFSGNRLNNLFYY